MDKMSIFYRAKNTNNYIELGNVLGGYIGSAETREDLNGAIAICKSEHLKIAFAIKRGLNKFDDIRTLIESIGDLIVASDTKATIFNDICVNSYSSKYKGNAGIVVISDSVYRSRQNFPIQEVSEIKSLFRFVTTKESMKLSDI